MKKIENTPFLSARLLTSVSACFLVGCSHLGESRKNQAETLKLQLPISSGEVQPKTVEGADFKYQANVGERVTSLEERFEQIPFLNVDSVDNVEPVEGRSPALKTQKIEAYINPLPIPQFLDAAFGQILDTPFVMGKEVAERKEVITLRSSGKMSPDVFLDLIKIALEGYGVSVFAEGGVFKIVDDKILRASVPTFIKSRSGRDTPAGLRPIVQFKELVALDAGVAQGLIQKAFSSKKNKINVEADRANNFLIVSGLPEDVAKSIDVISELDELKFAGSMVRSYNPEYWNTSEFVKALAGALRTEGWQVAASPLESRTISLMPVPYTNDVFIFAKTMEAHNRISFWLNKLDKAPNGGETANIHTYQVKNVDAGILAGTANKVISAGPVGSGDGPAGSQFTVDVIGNRIIFTGTAKDRDRYYELLRGLDTPAPEVLIQVKIAEVTLSDETSFGVEFFLDDLGSNAYSATAQTAGLGVGSNGLLYKILTGNVSASVNAFAENRRVKVLSTPTLVARSGGSASIQVGQDVPIVTSQRAANNQDSEGPLDILQGIAYRKTGVLLQIEPIVFSNDRIDLSITQEVSSTLANSNSSISSPTISNRSLTTQLSLTDGQTAVMGGLIQEDFVRTDTGIPLLKDIPLVGQVFSNDSLSKTRTELVVLITAYVLRGQDEKNSFVRQYSQDIQDYLNDDSRLVTLLPRQY